MIQEKVKGMTIDELIERAAKVIRDSWVSDEDTEDRIGDAAYIIGSRFDWKDHHGTIGIVEERLREILL